MKDNKKIVFDIDNQLKSKILAKQDDIYSRYIEFTLYMNNIILDLTGHTVKIYAQKADTTIIFNNATITDAANGKVLVELTSQALAVVGDLNCELVIYGSDSSILSSSTFTIDVKKSMRSAGALQSTNEVTALTLALTNINNHIANNSNPHSTTKTQIGLSNIPNIDATQANNIGIVDAGSIITATTVEGALQEIATKIIATQADVTTANYSELLTQNSNLFNLGTGKNASLVDIDVSSKVVNGNINYSIEGNTTDVHIGGVVSDFTGKITGSTVVNPNIFNQSTSQTALGNPSGFAGETTQAEYDKLKILDGISKAGISATTGTIPQHLFSFNIVAVYERKYGSIPITVTGVPATDLASKIAWLKANITNMTCNWTGFGSHPLGNKAYLNEWNGTSWVGSSSNTASVPTLLVRTLDAGKIQADGFTYLLAYTDASNGVANSTINTDYINLSFSFIPRYKSVGEDVGGLGIHQIDLWSKDAGSNEDKITAKLTKPLRKVNTVTDKLSSTGIVTRNISDWITLDGSLSWTLATTAIGLKVAYMSGYITTLGGIGNSVAQGKTGEILKGNSSTFLNWATSGANSDNFNFTSGNMYLSVATIDSGFIDSYSPSANEVKSYFNGWKICHSDGVSPYQVSETNYTPTTWAEWTKTGLVTADSTGLEFTSDGTTVSNVLIPTTLKVSTKYGFLYNIVSSTITGSSMFILSSTGAFATSTLMPDTTVGNKKFTATTPATIATNIQKMVFNNPVPSGSKLKLKDFRVFELPVGSQIETDFNTLTADQLTAKYMFYGLNPKNWKKVTDGTGITTTLPTATYAGYTPYKMLYQLATPVTETVNVDTAKPNEPTGLLPLLGFAGGSLAITSGVTPTFKYTVPINYRAMGYDNMADIKALKAYVLNLDLFATASVLSLADLQLRMKAIALLTTETTTDLKNKINEILNIWKV